MAAKEIKSELKSAREAIQNKDFQAALKHCKAVLKLDKTNYNAFVFVGVATLEMGKPEQAQAAYKKAIGINSENILAWQGLTSLYEKGHEFENKEDMVEVYEKLIDHYQSSDKTKWREMVLKLADLHKLLKNIEKLIDIYKILLHGNNVEANEETEVIYQNYITLLLNQKVENMMRLKLDILTEANRMRALFIRSEFPLQVLARMHLEEILEVKKDESTIYEELLEIVPGSAFAFLGFGKVKFFEKDMTQAEELLRKGLERLPTSSPGCFFLSTIQLSCHKYSDAEQSASTGLSCLKKETFEGNIDTIHFNLCMCRATACSKQGKEKMCAAVKYFEELLPLRPNALDVHVQLGKTFLRLSDLDSAKKSLESCRGINNAVPTWLSLEIFLDALSNCANSYAIQGKYHEDEKTKKERKKFYSLEISGEIYSAEGQYEKAEKSFLQLMELQSDVAEHYLNLGKIYWKMEGHWRSDKDKCLNHLIKAVKLDSLNCSAFLYLGHYYKVISLDVSKAYRCYKKAHDLDPCSDEAGEALGDACMSLELEEEAVQLYKKFTAAVGIGRAKWAWLRLGLYHLKHEKHNASVQCLQNALRVDVNDPNSWECLGEAYMSRGSYTAALASFTRATELDPSLLYSRYQIASVKHLLGLLDEAVLVYKEILDEHDDYVPALKGLGETYISFARSALSQDFYSRAVSYIQKAIVMLASAVHSHGTLSCLWKLLGDACSLVYQIHEDKIRLELPMNLVTFMRSGDGNSVGKKEVLTLASSSFGQAVRYNMKCSGLWHDLGLSYFRMASVYEDVEERQRLCERSIKALKKGLSMEPGNHSIWNTLGVVTASKGVSNPELSQHAFIKSIQSQKNAKAWTNLGVLYLLYGKADMANRAFNDAQRTEPSYTHAWVGQATIAEMFGNAESMDLYRHANELGTHVEGYLGYAHWVCLTLLSTNDGQGSCVMKGKPFADLSHLPATFRTIVLTASVALTKYTDQIQDNPCAFNMHGILLEHQKLYSQAENAYANSLKLLESRDDPNKDYCNIVRANYARVLCALGKYSESIKAYQAISSLKDFYHITGLALAFFMAGQLPESYQAYEQACELTTNDDHKSHIKAAMGMIGYVLNDIAGSKQILYGSSQMQAASEQGLLALSAVGLITSDVALAAAALSELVKVGQGGNENLIAEACYLFAIFYALQGSPVVGKNYIVNEIHRRPHSSLLWSNLAMFMIRFQPNNLKEAGQCAEAAHRLGDRNIKDIATKCAYTTIGAGRNPVPSDSTREIRRSRRQFCGSHAAQKAVHMQPDSFANWALLAAAVTDVMVGHEQERLVMSQRGLCEAVTQFALAKVIEESKNPSTMLQICERKNLQLLESIQKWLALQLAYCLHYSKKREEAVKHCQEALQVWGADHSFSARIQLLVVEIDSRCENLQIPSILDDIGKVLVLNQEVFYAWLFAALFHERHGFIKAAEYCYRHCLQLASKQGSLHGQVISLLRLALLALRQTKKENEKSHWVGLIVEATGEALNLLPDCKPAILLQGISHYLNNHIRQAKDQLGTIVDSRFGYGTVASLYLVLLDMKKRDKGVTIEDVVGKATSDNVSTLQDILLYFLAFHFQGIQRKKLLLKCIHANPSEPRFWNALEKL